MRARQAEAAKLRAPRHDVLLREFLREERLEVLDGRHVVRELVDGVLRVLGGLERVVLGDGTMGGLECAGDEVQKGVLASSVCAENGNVRVHAA